MKSINYYLTLLSLFSLSILFAQPTPPSGRRWVKVNELSDEFNQSNGIDGNKWHDTHPFWAGRAPSNFKKGNAFVRDGFLQLRSTLRRDPNSVGDRFKDIWVDAAAVVSKSRAKPGYYYEARMKASSLSMTSSFWFRVGQFSEIDVIEHIGDPSRPNRQNDLPFQYHANTHYYGKHAGLGNLPAEWRMPARGRDRFHNFGFWWKSPRELLFYYNGRQVMRIVPRAPLDENLLMIFDTEVFPFATAGVANIGLPRPARLRDNSKNTMLVDWVRVFRLANANGGGNPGSGGGAPIGRTISLRKSGGNRNFITAERDGNNQMIARGTSAGPWEQYVVESHPKGGIALRAKSNNKYLQVQNKNLNAPVVARGNAKGDWEHFQWKSKGNGKVAIRSAHAEKWLQASWTDNAAVVFPRGPVDQGWETFEFSVLGGKEAAVIEEDTAITLNAFPNPTTDILYIDGAAEDDIVYITDMMGRRIYEGVLNKEFNEIQTSSWPQGVYILHTSRNKETLRIIKQ